MALITWDTVNIGAGVTLSNGNLTATLPNDSNTARAIEGRTTGKWYWEIKIDSLSSALIGIVNASAPLTTSNYNNPNVRYYYAPYGTKYPNAVNYGINSTFGDIIGVALDLDNGTLTYYKNGISLGIAFSDIKSLGEVYPAVSNGASNTGAISVNFGRTGFLYPIPTGYKAYDNTLLKILLKSNNKVYSLKSNEILHETKMTSNTAPSPFVASASGFYSTSNESWRAFNGTNASGADCWMGTNGSKSGWIQLDFGSNKKVNTVTITSRNDSTGATQSPKDFNVLGSNDGVNYVKIGAFTNITSWGVNVANTFHLSDGDYRYYKIDVLSNVNNTIVSIGKIVFGYAENITTELSHASRQNLINYGSSTIKNFNTIHTNKRYILQDEVSKNEDGLLEQQANRKPLSVKFNYRKI